MNKYTKYMIAAAFVAVVFGGGFYLFRGQIALFLMERVVANNMSSGDAISQLEDGLHVALCGAGSPLPDVNRSGPCVAVVAGKQMFIIDAGTNGARNLTRMRWTPGNIDAVLLTHFHSDHIDGLGELALLRWINAGHKTPLPVFGPQGTELIVEGLNLAYRADVGYRTAHHGANIAPPSGAGMMAKTFRVPPFQQLRTIWDKDDVKISAFRVAHDPIDPAVGYKIDYKNRSLVISGDTKKIAAMAVIAKNADLLVHEALSTELVSIITRAAQEAGNHRLAKITIDILDYHTSPVEAAQIAQKAKVKHLLYYHIVPPLPLAGLKDIFLRGTSTAFDGNITLGQDGTLISLPAGNDSIIVDELL